MHGATVKVYSLAKDGDKKITDHFRVREFKCSDGSDTIFISQALVEILEDIRCHFGKPITINSGYRTDFHNNKTKNAAKYSQHKYGLAADISSKYVRPSQIAAYAETLLPNTGGIGLYIKDGFVHIDVRTTRARWNG